MAGGVSITTKEISEDLRNISNSQEWQNYDKVACLLTQWIA